MRTQRYIKRVHYVGVSASGYAIFYDKADGSHEKVSRNFRSFEEAVFELKKYTKDEVEKKV